jgi:molybdopterin converting factor small subunit
VTVELLGIASIGGGRRRLDLPLSEPTSVRDVLRLVSEQLGGAVSPKQLEDRHMILVEGLNILHQEGWDTLVRPGHRVSVVPLLGGG